MTAEAAIGNLAAVGDRLARAETLEAVVDIALADLAELFGYRSCLLLVHQPESGRLVTLATRGYATGGVGSEVVLGEGVIGMVATRRRPMRIGNLQRMLRYARAARPKAPEGVSGDIELPGLPDARSQLAAPMIARGVLVGVLAVESPDALAYEEVDEHVLSVVAHWVAAALDRDQASEPDSDLRASGPSEPLAEPVQPAAAPGSEAHGTLPAVRLRHYAVDGSTFLDDSYVIKGVAGRLLWKVVSEHAATGRIFFSNREARLDPTLELPPYRDNFESRLILLKRRLEEHQAPVRVTSTSRGRFELRVSAPLILEHVERP